MPPFPTAMRRASLAVALAVTLFPSPRAAAQSAPLPPASDTRHANAADSDSHIKALTGVVVTANAPRDTISLLGKPTEVLRGERLDEHRAASLGETIANLPGVQSSNFGPAAARPIIRGMEGPRVTVLNGGLSSQDVSTISQDHAPAVEPFLADQIEVLKGPATLRFGSGAIGGAVNVIDGRIPEDPIENGFSARAETRWSADAQSGNTSMARLDAGNAHYAVHADAVYRNALDYRTPLGRQANTFIDTRTGSLGGSMLGDWGFVGLSAARFENTYGNPGEPGDHSINEPGVHLKMQQNHYKLNSTLRDLWSPGNDLTITLAHTGYQHTEFDGGQPGTVFRKNANEGRIEASFGQPTGWQSLIGAQFSSSAFAALGEEAFVPATHTRAQGIFVVARRTLGGIQFDLGARIDNTQLRPDNSRTRHFSPRSLSLAGAWMLNTHWVLTASFDHAERAPAEEELFSHGPHLATLAYEVGNAQLRKEAAQQLELGLHYQSSRIDTKLSVYHNHYRNFIYLADTDDHWYWEEAHKPLPVREWAQRNASFRGLEGEATFHLAANLHGDWDLRIFGDHVRATFTGGDNLPRIAPARLGAQLRWEHAGWRAALGATRTYRQRDVAHHETPTAGYTLVDAHATRHFDTDNLSWELFADASNLTNQIAQVHTSFLKDQVRLPGRSVAFGVRLFF